MFKHAAVLLAIVVVGCEGRPGITRSSPAAVAPPALAPSHYATVMIPGVPHVRQKPDFCGEACVEMALRRLGKDFDQDAVFDMSGLDPTLGKGATTRELRTALERIGFRPGDVWYRIDAAEPAPGLEAQFAAVHEDLVKGVPSILCMHYADRPETTEHFRLVVGYDASTDEVIYQEPAEDQGGYRRMRREMLYRLWPLKYEAAAWTLIRLRLEPGAIADTPPRRGGVSPAALAQRVMSVRKKAPASFTIVVEPPFVVVGDERPEVVKSRAEGTVRWAVQHLKKDFFDADPKAVLEVWLFGTAPSYRQNALAIFGDRPSTPYGYYSSEHGALIMNIATGGGTLVHEIVHPFVEADFPGAPPWLNEGLGSLFEASDERDGHIVGGTNWRLPALKKAIRAGTVPSFKQLTGQTTTQFYDEDPGTNYAQSRYLLYWLQEKGFLTRFYRAFRAGRAKDPTGYETLRKVIGEQDMDAFKARWESFVLGLSFP